MTFWDVVWLTLLYWFLGSVWIVLYFGHQIKKSEMDQKYIDTEYELEKLKAQQKRVDRG